MKIFYYIFSITVFLIASFCIISPSEMINSAKNGISLWFNIVLPSLFPFLILSDLIQKSAITKVFEKLLSNIMKPIFKLPGISSLAIFLGMTGGYPIGAKITSDLRNNNSLSKTEAKRLLAFSNNSGPLFISGAIGIGLYKNASIGFLLLISHYISALLVGILFRFYKKEKVTPNSKNLIQFSFIKLSSLGETLTNTVKKAITTVTVIGGFIVIFSILTTILEKTGLLLLISKIIMPNLDTDFSASIISGILEVTNGVNRIFNLSSVNLTAKLIVTSALIGFGGFSVHMQTLSVISSSDIGSSTYFIGKTLQSIFSGIITFMLLHYTNFSLLIYEPTFASDVYNSYGFIKLISTVTLVFLFIVMFKIVQTLIDEHV